MIDRHRQWEQKKTRLKNQALDTEPEKREGEKVKGKEEKRGEE